MQFPVLAFSAFPGRELYRKFVFVSYTFLLWNGGSSQWCVLSELCLCHLIPTNVTSQCPGLRLVSAPQPGSLPASPSVLTILPTLQLFWKEFSLGLSTKCFSL